MSPEQISAPGEVDHRADIKNEISQTVSDHTAVNEELHYLLEALL